MKIVAEPKEIPTIMTLMMDVSDARDFLGAWKEMNGKLPTVAMDHETNAIMIIMGLLDDLGKLGLTEYAPENTTKSARERIASKAGDVRDALRNYAEYSATIETPTPADSLAYAVNNLLRRLDDMGLM